MVLLVVAMAVGMPLRAGAQPEAQCDREMQAAEAQYLEGRFEETISLVSACLDKPGLPDAEAVQAYRMLALANLNRGDLGAARMAIAKLLRIDPGYVPEAVLEPPSQAYSYSFAGLVISIKQQMNVPLTRRERSLLKVFAQKETVHAARLIEADEAYLAGEHDRTIALTRDELRTDSLSVVERAEAYRIQGLAYSAQGKEKGARKAATELIMLYPDYVPSADDPDVFVDLVEEAQQRYKSGAIHREIVQKRRRIQLGYWIVGLAGAAAILGVASQDW
jgi:tetratricopeptide (TPR) repeat protein